MLGGLRSDLSTPPLLGRDFHDLHLESTLQELSLWQCQLECSLFAKEVVHQFQKNPLLPGIILMDDGEFIGMISRRRFLEHLSKPYGLELFLQRPLTSLYRFAQTEIVLVPSTLLIVEAARQSLSRSGELLYEPIVVQVAPKDYRLLDVHQLLIAQSKIHELATQLLLQTRLELETANQQLHHLARLDELTQLANRRRFDEYLNIEWRRLAREQAPLCLMMCDIDFFKLYNDTYGHSAGDDCLRQVADALRKAVKRPADLVARYGGEEFAVILPNTDTKGGLQVAEHIRENVRNLQLFHGKSPIGCTVTLSCGISSVIPHAHDSPAQLIDTADQALYQAKAAGRNQIIAQIYKCA
jgi:diguanylate cyclase (GGDEF)-like protein